MERWISTGRTRNTRAGLVIQTQNTGWVNDFHILYNFIFHSANLVK